MVGKLVRSNPMQIATFTSVYKDVHEVIILAVKGKGDSIKDIDGV